MRSYDLAPLFRSTIGFDRILEMLNDRSSRPGWPPYNIEKTDSDRYSIKMAIAGFSAEEVDVTQQGNILTVTGEKSDDPNHAEMLYQGIAFRNFRQTFNLTERMKVVAADLEDGLLSIDLVREVPEELRPRRILVGAPANAQDNRPNAEQPDSELQSQAA